MATFASDTFTDAAGTALASHTADLGGPWVDHPATAGLSVISNENRARNSSTPAMYYLTAAPASADYDVEAVLHVKSVIAGEFSGPVGRLDTSGDTHYWATYRQSTGEWVLQKRVGSTATNLGTFTQTLSVGTSYTVKLEMRGTAIKVYVGGVERISATDAAITAAGRAGFRLGGATQSNTTGIHIDSLSAVDVVVAPAAGASAQGPVPVPAVAPAVTVGAAAAEASAPAVVVTDSATAPAGEATADAGPPTITVVEDVTTPVRGGLVAVPRYDVEALFPVKPSAAVAVASMPAPAVVAVEDPVEEPVQEPPPPAPRIVVPHFEPLEPLPVHRTVPARPAVAVARGMVVSTEVETFEQAVDRLSDEKAADKRRHYRRRAEEELAAMAMLS